MSVRPNGPVAPEAPAEGFDVSTAWVLAVGLLAITAALGLVAGSVARPVFILGGAAIGVIGWRQSPEAHLKALLTLFCFAPLVRRLIDMKAGYDPSGLVLVAPLIAVGIPLLLVFEDLTPERLRHPQVGPILTIAACVLYAVMLTIFQGEWMNAISNAVKSFAPIAYALSLIASRAKPERLIDAATSAFIVILPIMGLYGIYQYIDPLEWDRFWMKSATILSAGQPEPYQVRTFSVLNAPASFATFTAVGMLLVFFLRLNLVTIILMIPAAVSLMLSQYRTAWIVLATGILFSLLFNATRGRASAAIAAIAAIITGTLFTPFGSVILDRFSTLTEGAGDGSARERLDQFVSMWMRPDSGLIGSGFATVDVGSAGSMAIDGMFITCWMAMGLVVGMICIGGLFWAMMNAIAAAFADRRSTAVVIGALGLAGFTELPLTNVISSELGFLFWTFIVLLPVPMMAPAYNPFREAR